MTWTFYFLLFGLAFGAVILAEVWEQVDEKRTPRKAGRSTKERRKANNTFRGEYTTRGRNNANTY